MTITGRKPIIIAAIIAALAVGALAYALTQQTHDRTTGTFSLDAEAANVTVTTLNNVTGAAEPTWASCTRTGDSAAVGYCLYSITNDRVSGPVTIGTGLASYAGNSALANALSVEFKPSSTLTTCTDANFGSWGTMPAAGTISSLPFAPGAANISPGNTLHICARVYFASAPPVEAFGKSLTAVVRVVSDVPED